MKRLPTFLFLLCAGFITCTACAYGSKEEGIITGAQNTAAYFPLLQGKRVGVLANQSSLIGEKHLIDSLLAAGINVRLIFAPEHGFKGTLEAGAAVANSKEAGSDIPIISLYGKQYAPSDSLMQQLDIAVFDLQDVGLRFYTYLSSLYYFMESCARNQVPLIVLDRPNPNGHSVSGPVLDMQYRSFVGIIPVPVMHGMTLGELALMINGSHWLENGMDANLTIIPCQNYSHQSTYVLPIKPSPNLPNNRAIYLYPSLCLFEATVVDVARGTPLAFQVYGHKQMQKSDFAFTSAKGEMCKGKDLSSFPSDETIRNEGFTLKYVIDAFHNLQESEEIGEAFFLSNFFEKLVGVSYVREMIMEGKSAEEIAACWAAPLESFKKERKRYLIYE